jgi:hypothetical protein
MQAGSTVLLAGLDAGPWQPQSIRPPVRETMPLRLRVGVLAAVALLHVLATWLLLGLADRNRQASDDDAIVVDFIDAPAPPPPPSPNETITIRMPRTPAPSQSSSKSATKPARPARARGEAPMQVAEAQRPLQLYNLDGSLRVPEDMLDKLDKQFGDQRVFSYQIPHMDDAKKYFERNPALAYEATRFDKYWTPEGDVLTVLLTKMVQATTKEVKMKVPGSPNSYMVCKISILAFGGGCGVLTEGSDWNGPQDDPNTLNPEEDRQCAAWWRQIIGARTQDAWRATKQLYERECRKPLLRPPSG